MDKNNIINLEKEIRRQQRKINEFSQSDINDLTDGGIQQIAETMTKLEINIGILFDFVKTTAEITRENKRRIEELEKNK